MQRFKASRIPLLSDCGIQLSLSYLTAVMITIAGCVVDWLLL